MAYSSVEYEAGDVVFHEGDLSTYMCLIQNGRFEVVTELGGYDKQVAILERGDFFGEMAVLDDEPRSHMVRALEVGKLIKIERADFPSLLMKKPEIAARMIRKLSHRLVDTEDMLLRAWAGVASHEEKAEMTDVRARLVVLPDNTELELPVQEIVHIGRVDPVNQVEPDLDLTSIDTSLTTSRRHALLLRRGEGFYIQEERATNGTYVNGTRVSAEHPLEIRSGDDIMFGAVHMRFHVG